MKTPDKLTVPMVSFLETLFQAGGSVTTQYARTQAETNTRKAAQERGLAHYFPCGNRGRGSWRISSDGKIALERWHKMKNSTDEAATAARILADVSWNHDHSALRCPTWQPGDIRAFEAAVRADADRKKLFDLARQQEEKIARLEAQIKDLETGIRLQLVKHSLPAENMIAARRWVKKHPEFKTEA